MTDIQPHEEPEVQQARQRRPGFAAKFVGAMVNAFARGIGYGLARDLLRAATKGTKL